MPNITHQDDDEDYVDGDVSLDDIDPDELERLEAVLGAPDRDPDDPEAALREIYGDELEVW